MKRIIPVALLLLLLTACGEDEHEIYTSVPTAAPPATTPFVFSITTTTKVEYETAPLEGLTELYTVPNGEVLDVNFYENQIIIKTKIKPSYNNEATIHQNYFNIEDLIKNQGCDKYDVIQYWAVADMTDGSESKVIAFDVPSSAISGIKNGTIVANQLGDYVDNLYILPSLKE